MSSKVVSLGIDLGTTNSTMAYAEGEQPRIIDVPQVEQPGAVVAHAQMPSALYIPLDAECKQGGFSLPWDKDPQFVVGRFARERASTAPQRVVLSAKSWLCNSQVDRKSAILPWGSSEIERQVSPFEASSLFLSHLRSAAEQVLTQHNNLDDVEVVLTVPASFDEVARNLTVDAAKAAGLSRVTLLEEPLAALYSWLSRSGDSWREQISVGDVISVVDIGGGTADFSLVLVGEENGNLSLERLSVGDHILLGGDNMDLALAYQLRQKLESQGASLDNWQFYSLVHEARLVKERMLTQGDEKLPVTLAGRGSSLFASTLQTEAVRDEVVDLLLNGFFPEVSFDDLPEESDEVGLGEFGLPFESEPALSKHLARFLRNSNEQVARRDNLPGDILERASKCELMPTAVLFNGGVCRSELARMRVLGLLKQWSGGGEVRELSGTDVDCAVAEGAAHYGQIKRCSDARHLRIRAGVPRSYYIGLKHSMPAVPGLRPAIKGVCVVEQDTEEGSQCALQNQKFSLITGKEVEFRFFSSQQRPGDKVGDVVEDAEKMLSESARMSATLPAVEGATSQSVPVELQSKVTDVGTLELWMQAVGSEQRWKLEFDVRAEKKTP